ncbi:EcsC family protein [Halalkalibacter hemicellulosilyticus]|uniref:EcsC protein n=1 Tax=Halalkalibacter hemicellulosilyticusJCM 9152 TaxID=1236971 RepID=W4QE93_9BACI|nr:EcsC family protein [Halalkalibacter hemicellulosilyticus]GAE30376.1 EcsC protein [Halalkalibacter hemicellulosilyticusJCM 9152]
MYEETVYEELDRWKRKLTKRQSMMGRYTKGLQAKVNGLIPEKVHTFVTTSIKNMTHATLIGSEYTTKIEPKQGLSLSERDENFKEILTSYKRTAALEGAGTGAGGIILGMVDFPLLLSIKMKFLFDTAATYGYDVHDYRERLFVLYLFQLAFSREEKRPMLLERIENWTEEKEKLPSKDVYLAEVDWKSFQLDYRDYIDLPKMLQLIPGFGAIVGATANYRFLEILGETAMNGYRMRLLEDKKEYRRKP